MFFYRNFSSGFLFYGTFSFCFLLMLQTIQVIFKRIQFHVPECTVLFNPVGYFIEFIEPGLAKTFPAFLPYFDKSAFRQYLNVFRDRGPAYLEMIGYRI